MIKDKYSNLEVWNRWYNTKLLGANAWESVFEKESKNIPKNIKRVVDLGWAAGRNLLFFEKVSQIENLVGIEHISILSSTTFTWCIL